MERFLLSGFNSTLRTIDIKVVGILFLTLAASLQVRLATLYELLLIRQLLVEHVGLY